MKKKVKRFLPTIVIMCIVFSFLGCDKEKDLPEKNNEKESIVESFVGGWNDTYSERCYMIIECTDGINYSIDIEWSGSAFDRCRWELHGTYDDEKDGIVYSGAAIHEIYNDDDTCEENYLYRDGKGLIYIGRNGKLYWEDYEEDAGANCQFVKADNQTDSDIEELVTTDYYVENYLSQLQKLQQLVNYVSCVTDIEYVTVFEGGETYTRFLSTSDNCYFDEIVCNAWYYEDGTPKADWLPAGLTTFGLNDYIGWDYSHSVENFHFVDGERFTLGQLKRYNKNSKDVFAMVVTNVTKRTIESDNRSEIIYEGYDYISFEPVVFHTDISGILNGDDLLIVGTFRGVASDDTVNLDVGHVEIITEGLLQ